MPDFSLLQNPNFGALALGGYQAGQKIQQQRGLQEALGNVDIENPASIMGVMRYDPAAGTALLGASMKAAEYKHELASKAAMSDFLLARQSAGTVASPTATPAPIGNMADAAPVATAANSAIGTPDDGGITVTAHRDAPDPLESARTAFIKANPKGYMSMQEQFGKMDASTLKAASDKTEYLDNVLQGAKGLPYEQRRQFIATHRPQLVAAGIPQQQVDSFDPTDQAITALDNEVLGVKGVQDRVEKDRAFTETQRHNRVGEGNAAGNLAVSQGNLAVAQGNLAIRGKEFDAKPKAGGPIARDLPGGGKAYRNPANGKWYDNAEFQ